MFNASNYSQENLKRIKKVVEIILDELELQDINTFTGNKLPIKRFEQAGYSYTEVIDILDAIVKNEANLFKIGNEEIKRKVDRKSPTYIFDKSLVNKRKYRKELLEKLNISEEDLQNYIYLRLGDEHSINRLKEILISFELQLQQNIKKTSDLLSIIPSGGKYKVHRRMTKLFKQEGQVANYRLAACIEPTTLDHNRRRRKFKKDDYDKNKNPYDSRIKNTFRVLNKLFKKINYRVKFHSETSKILQPK